MFAVRPRPPSSSGVVLTAIAPITLPVTVIIAGLPDAMDAVNNASVVPMSAKQLESWNW